MSRIVIALGGNALLDKSSKGTAAEQMASAQSAITQLEHTIKENQVVLTHGNGPQVGNLLLKQQATDEVPQMPLYVLDAMTEGQIGYFIASAISQLRLHCANLMTRVVVDPNDPAFKNPSKPIGPFYKKKIEEGMINDAGRGFRKVVASPEPIKIREHDAISALLEKGFVVIAVGGGGIPITEEGVGLEAVIDKDKATSLLASQINAQTLVFVTSVDSVYLNFGTDNQERIEEMTVTQAKQYLKENQFAAGSMKPKVLSAIRFLEKGGEKAIICSIENAESAIEGAAGTTIIP
jgi:carbamate kinase